MLINDQEVLSVSAYFPTDGDRECQSKFEEYVTDLEAFINVNICATHIYF